MPNVYGMDTSDFPGHAVLGWYWANCGFRYTDFYVAPAPRHPNQSWMSQRDELAAAGWGFLPVLSAYKSTPRASAQPTELNMERTRPG
jgi:hypothetical protein